MAQRTLPLYTFILSTVLTTLHPALANEAPTAPQNLTVVVTQPNLVQLEWQASTDDKRVKNYLIHRNDVQISTTRNTSYRDTSALPLSSYEYSVIANDGSLVSDATSVLVNTPAAEDPSEEENPSTKPGKGRGGKKNQPESEPPFEEPPVEDPPVEEPPVEEPPTEAPESTGAPDGWQLSLSDEFDGDGNLDIGTGSNWRFESMDDGLHRAGNTGIDRNGNIVAEWDSAEGKRWSAWYDNYHNINAYRENGNLVLGGYHSGIDDPTRPIEYVDDGVPTAYGESKLYTAWIDTFSRKWVGPGDYHIMDPASPGKIFKYAYIEMRVNFSEMRTPGFRLSAWLMPASNDAEGRDLVVSGAYDNDGNNGVEIDLFEYEWINESYENQIIMSVHGGAAGNNASIIDTSTFGMNIHEGYHTIGFLWKEDQMVWSIDGEVVKEVTDSDLIPDVYSYLIISREMNSGVKRSGIDSIESTDMLEQAPYIPRDPGLYAENIWEYRDRINSDQALIDYVRIWQP